MDNSVITSIDKDLLRRQIKQAESEVAQSIGFSLIKKRDAPIRNIDRALWTITIARANAAASVRLD
jgi:hypothetical protein